MTYNYIKTLNPFKVDALYIKDTWGYRGSYYLMDHGNCRPYDSVLNLIYKILSRKKYSRIICIGSSKGGSAAILFGLKIGATKFFLEPANISYRHLRCKISRGV